MMIEENARPSRLMSVRRPLYAACLLALTVWGGTGVVHAQSSEAPRAYMIEAGSLEAALNQLARQSQVQIVFRPDLVAGKRAAALSGELTWRQALERLLHGSGLEYRQVADKTIVIQTSGSRSAPTPQSVETSKAPALRSDPGVTDIERMTVTGTRIRGGVTPSPVITIGSERIREEGFTDLGEVVRSLPQNFNGGQNPGVASGSGDFANQNFTGGSALNLRGLGPDATLTLLNGRRLTYDGLGQAVDISAIPIEAVERLEVVPDGASAIYGSDAVGGVANVTLKRDFDGVVLAARHGEASEGGLGTEEYSATAGVTWESGGFIATWKKTSADPVFVEQRDYTTYMPTPNTLYPGVDQSSGLLSIHQSLGEVAELRLDALKTRREQTQYIDYPAFYYYAVPKTTITLWSPSMDIYLPNDWILTAGGTYGKDEYVYRTFYVTTASSRLQNNGCYCNESRSYELGAEGPLFDLGGGAARMAVGIGSRTSEYIDRPYLANDGYSGDSRAHYGYAEISLPFVSPASNVAGINRLEVSAAVRREDHDSFGGVTTPKVGLIYSPSADFTIKASWGRSFKAPTLYQQYSDSVAYLFTAPTVGGSGYAPDATVLMSYGGNPDLDPERARTWTTSVAFHPEAIPALEAELTWFDIEYTDRVILPVSNYFQALNNPNYAPFVDYNVTPAQQEALLGRFATFQNFAGAAYDPSRVVAIINDQYINVARQKIRGVDLSGAYRFDIGAGGLTVRGSASWLDSEQQNSVGQSSYDLSGTIFQPSKVRARLGAVWTQGGFSTSAFMNYASGVTSRLTALSEKTASFVTVDAALRYDTGLRDDALSGLGFELSAQNLLNRAPPLYTPTSVNRVPFDSTNYSAIGRFVSFSVSKRW